MIGAPSDFDTTAPQPILTEADRKFVLAFAAAMEQDIAGMQQATREGVSTTLTAPPFPMVPQRRFQTGSPEDRSAEIGQAISRAVDAAVAAGADINTPGIVSLLEMLTTAQCRDHVHAILGSFSTANLQHMVMRYVAGDPATAAAINGESGGNILSDNVRGLQEAAGSFMAAQLEDYFQSPLLARMSQTEHRDHLLIFLQSLFAIGGVPHHLIDMDIRDDTSFAIMGNIRHRKHRLPGMTPDGKEEDASAFMGRAQLMRFVQLPQVARWLADEELNPNRPPFMFATTTAVAAECYAENKHLMDRNEITEADVEEWIARKLERHDPNYLISLYLFGRLAWGQFYPVAFSAVAPHLKKKLLEETAVCAGAQDIEKKDYFTLISEAVDRVVADPNTTLTQIQETLLSVPLPMTAPTNQENRHLMESGIETRASLQRLRRAREKLLAKAQQAADAITPQNINPFISDIETLRLLPAQLERNGYLELRGFPHFDQIGLTDMVIMIPAMITAQLIADTMERVLPHCNEADLVRFGEALCRNRNAVSDINAIFERIFHEKVGRRFVRDEADTDLRDMSEARDPETPAVRRVAEATAGEIARFGMKVHSGPLERAGLAAESELLHRHLDGTREGQGLIRFLLRHNQEMRLPELVIPFDDALNPEVIREFASHPDLFALLQITTLLQYLGHPKEAVMQEIRLHAEQAEKLHHPDMQPIGVELEQANWEGRIVNPRYAWLLNVMLRGNDWSSSHEVTTARTHSPYLQSILLALITRPEFGFMNTAEVWAEQDRGIPTNSIHVSLAIPRDLDATGAPADQVLANLSNAIAIAYNSRIRTHHDRPENWNIRLGELSYSSGRWKWPHSILDTTGAISHRARLEEKSGALSRTGAHEDLVEAVWALGNAGLHHWRESRRDGSVAPAPFARRLAEIYTRFLADYRRALDPSRPLGDVHREGDLGNITGNLRAVLKHHTQAVMAEVGTSVVMADATGRIIKPYRVATAGILAQA